MQPPEPTVDSEAEMRTFLERVVVAIGALEKGNPRDWLNDGRPDATQLSRLWGATVSASVRDAAWTIAQQRAETPKSVLSRVLKKKGARFLRQVCESRQWSTARSGEDLVRIVAERVTFDEAKALEA
ncbi:hypothetical protein ABIE65_005415 [Constrictibacter sp. MBR-5]